jgi:hypothetical protein
VTLLFSFIFMFFNRPTAAPLVICCCSWSSRRACSAADAEPHSPSRPCRTQLSLVCGISSPTTAVGRGGKNILCRWDTFISVLFCFVFFFFFFLFFFFFFLFFFFFFFFFYFFFSFFFFFFFFFLIVCFYSFLLLLFIIIIILFYFLGFF